MPEGDGGAERLGHEFVRAYTAHLREIKPDLLPATIADSELVLRSWVLEKALYEVRYELNTRPDWVDIPLRAVLNILGSANNATTSPADGIAASRISDGSETPATVNGRKERGQ